MAVFSAESYCPLCGSIMDSWGDQCSCPCGGDRVVRHNAVRDVVYNECRDAGLTVECEKPGLLPPRSVEEGLPPTTSSRRPADVWQARGPSGGAEALDFSVRSGMANQFLERSASSPEEVLALMERGKRTHLDTFNVCRTAGFVFQPLILEAHGGGWTSALRYAMDWVASASAAHGLDSKEILSLRTAQRISCSLQRESARAVLRRTVPLHVPASINVQVADQLDATSLWQ